MKNKILIIVAILAVGCLGLVIFLSQNVSQTSKDLIQERYNRMVAEEKLEKALFKIQSLENELTNTQNQTQNLQTVLEKEKVASDKIRTELEKTSKLKEVLEKALKDALVEPPAPSPAGQ